MAKDKEAPRKLSRKDFVKGAAAVAGAGALASCAPAATPTVAPEATATTAPAAAPTPVPETWDMETDVLVVGGGHCGGLPAAIEAKKAGAEALVIEMGDHAGGLSAVGGDGFTMGGNNVVQQREGEVDDDEAWFQDEMYANDYRGSPEIMRALIERGPDTVVFLEDLGLEFALTNGALRPPIKRGVTVQPSPNYPGKDPLPDGGLSDGGIGFTYVMLQELDRLGIPVLLNHRMTRIHRPDKSGPVLGVEVETPEGTINIKARKAVHLGTGTWTDNYRMIQAWDPRAVGPDCYGDGGTPFNGKLIVDSAGDGHLAAAEIGAGFSDMSYVAYLYIFFGTRSYWGWYPLDWTKSNIQNSARTDLFDSAAQTERGILIKNDGARWINEAEAGRPSEPGYGSLSEHPEWPFPATYLSLPQPRNAWVVTDADGAAAMEWPLDDIRNPNPELSPLLDPACLAIADSLAELASKMNIPAAAFQDTVSRYNGFVDAGVDEDFGKPMPMYKLATPPFYGAKLSLIRHTQRNGLRVNTKSQVLEQSDQRDGYSGTSIDGSISIDDEKVISHLYAAGEIGNALGWRRIHNSVGHYITASRIAGENAAAETPLA